MTGPVQVLVVGFDQPTFSGEVMAELDRLGRAGTVRLLDVLLVSRAEDGTFETLPLPAGTPAGLGGLAAEILGDSSAGVPGAAAPAGGGATWSLADAIPVGGTAAVALIEHLWAARLRDAIQRTGGARSRRRGWPERTSNVWRRWSASRTAERVGVLSVRLCHEHGDGQVV